MNSVESDYPEGDSLCFHSKEKGKNYSGGDEGFYHF